MLTKETEIDRIEVVAGNHIQVREVTRVMDGGEVLSTSYRRWVLVPGADLKGQDERVQAVARAVWGNNA